jgi:hypothetical protein
VDDGHGSKPVWLLLNFRAYFIVYETLTRDLVSVYMPLLEERNAVCLYSLLSRAVSLQP